MHGQSGTYNYGAVEKGELGHKDSNKKCKKTLCWLIPVVSAVVIILLAVGICWVTGVFDRDTDKVYDGNYGIINNNYSMCATKDKKIKTPHRSDGSDEQEKFEASVRDEEEKFEAGVRARLFREPK